MLSRDEAIQLWKKYNDDDYLYRHALSVEASMRRFAVKYAEDPDYWGIVGLLHDIDYQKYPEEHLKHARSMLEPAGYTEDFIRAVESHGYGICTDVEPVHVMEKTLFAVDELTGFISACRPHEALEERDGPRGQVGEEEMGHGRLRGQDLLGTSSKRAPTCSAFSSTSSYRRRSWPCARCMRKSSFS